MLLLFPLKIVIMYHFIQYSGHQDCFVFFLIDMKIALRPETDYVQDMSEKLNHYLDKMLY